MRRHGPALLLLTLVSCVTRGLWLSQDVHPLGTDGYYYVVQAADLARLGRPHVPDSSWVLRLLGLVARVLPPVPAVAWTGALLAAAVVPAAWWLGTRWRGPRVGWALALWAAASPTLTQLAGDFLKNLGLVAPLTLGLALLCSSAPAARRPRLPTLLWAAGFLGLAATAHRLGAALLLLLGVGAGLDVLLDRWWARRAPTRVSTGDGAWWLIPLVLGAALFLLLSQFLPGLLHRADLGRLAGQFRGPGQPLPPRAWSLLRRSHVLQRIEWWSIWAALIVGFVPRAGRVPRARLLVPLLVLAAPLWNTTQLDLGYRLWLMAPLLAAPILVDRLLAASTAAPSPLWMALLGLALCPVALTGIGPRQAPPYPRYAALVERLPTPLPRLLIAHVGVNFLYDHRTGQEAMAWAPEPSLDPTQVGRLVWGVRPAEWRAHTPPGVPPARRLDLEYSYCREDTWRAFLAAARASGDDDLNERLDDWRNPQRVRPAALTRLRDSATEPDAADR